MSDAVITVENLSKRYLLGHQSISRERKSPFQEMVARSLNNFARKAADFVHGRQIIQGDEIEEFWALRDITFDVKQGEVLGIVGRNGAGKSTLLKILSRITEPTEGRALLRGRLASLLEVGTGFHPELTGRENIFLNGAVLGMSRQEIREKFDEIVAFAEVGKFIDTPVKRYSSGMYVRLAFAVAAFLDQDILIVDEVLAVGDAAFQKKCLSRMRDLERCSRTVLFVSHNIAAVSALCSKIMVLHEGRILYPLGDVPAGLEAYNALQENVRNVPLGARTDREGRGRARFSFVRCYGEDNAGEVVTGRAFTLEFTIRKDSTGVIEDVAIFVSVLGAEGGVVTVLTSEVSDCFRIVKDTEVVCCRMDRLPLSEGEYRINVMIRAGGVIEDWVQDAAAISVQYGNFFNRHVSVSKSHCGVLVEQEWTFDREHC